MRNEGERDTDYDKACADAATAQGLRPIIDALAAAGIDHEVEQTGGWVMVVTVPTPDGSTYAITHGSTTTGADGYLVCRYTDWQGGEDEGTEVGDDMTTADAVRIVR
jgi:hypothetical protein